MYETLDVPEDRTSDFYEDTEAECIERLHLSSDQSNNRFKGKYLTGNIDYSYDTVRGGCWELAAQGEKETPIEKFRRIKCEMDELMNEIVDLNATSQSLKREKDSYEAVSLAVNSAQKVLSTLRLENVLGKETASPASDIEIKKLIAQIEGFQKGRPTDTSTEIPKNLLEQTRRIAELEARLHRVEAIIGAHHPDKLNRLASALDTNGTLLDTVQQISTKAALLQPAQLDQIESKISVLTTKLNEFNDKVSPGKRGANDDKVSTLYDIAKRTEPIAKLLPDMLQRMQALEKLHNHGEFKRSLNHMRTQ